MKILFNSTRQFESDVKEFSSTQQETIINSINQTCQLLLVNKSAFFRKVYRPEKIYLNNGFNSSLYAFKVDANIRVILAVDMDPIYDQVIVSLLRVVQLEDIHKAFKSVANSLYRNLSLLQRNKEHVVHG